MTRCSLLGVRSRVSTGATKGVHGEFSRQAPHDDAQQACMRLDGEPRRRTHPSTK